VSNVLVDCQHNDWAWMFPTAPALDQYGVASLPVYTGTSPIPQPPFAFANTNTPGGRDFAMSWTDKNHNRCLFGGFGFELTHPGTDGVAGYLNDMWVWPTNPNTGLDDGWWLPGGWIPANLPITYNTSGYFADTTSLQLKNQQANYGSLGSGAGC